MQQLIEASLQGDSCIEISPEQIETLYQLVISVEQAKSQVAPCVHDGQGLALYRYWNLEQRLAEQIRRLKQQPIQPVSCEEHLDLLTDPHQRTALQMVTRQSLSIITGGRVQVRPIRLLVLLLCLVRQFRISVWRWLLRRVKLHSVCKKPYKTRLMIPNCLSRG